MPHASRFQTAGTFRRVRAIAHAGLLLASCAWVHAGVPVDLPRDPSVSPDGSEVVFSWRGDLWKVPSEGGAAVRLTSHPAIEASSAWSPDGRWIAFESERDGYRNIHLMHPDGSGLTQLTDADLTFALESFGTGADGEPAVLASAFLEGDLFRSPRPYEISIEGGVPRRVHDAYGSEAVSSPDGRFVAFTRGGSSWMRRHYRGSDARELWLFDRENGSFRQLTDWTGNDGRARWVGDGAIAFLSDRDGETVNAHLLRLDAGEDMPRAAALTRWRGEDVHGFDVSADGGTAVFATWDGLWTLDLRDPGARPVRVEATAPADVPDQVDVVDLEREATEATLSPDGKTMAVVAYGDVWVHPTEEGRSPRQVTRGIAREQGIAWSPDGLRLYFTSDRAGTDGLYVATVERTRGEVREHFDDAVAQEEAVVESPEADEESTAEGDADPSESGDDGAGETMPDAGADTTPDPVPDPALDPALDPARWADALTFEIAPLLDAATEDRMPRPSPDGRSLAFRRGRGDVCILDLESGEVRTLRPGWDAWVEYVWSPDSDWLALAVSDRDFNRDIHLFPADGEGTPVNVTRHPDTDAQPRFSADGKVLAFVSDRTGDEGDAWMVFLDRELDRMNERDLEAYFEAQRKAVKKRKPLPVAKAAVGGDDESTEISDEDSEEPDDGESVADASAPAEPAFTREDLEDAHRRLRRVTRIDGDERDLLLMPAGDRLVFTASGGPDEGRGVYAIDWDGGDLKRLGGSADLRGVSLDGGTLVTVSGGRARTMPVSGGGGDGFAIDERLEVDRVDRNLALFDEAARILGEGFYLDPAEKGLDWTALTARYRELAAASRTPDELEWVVNRLFGELNGSHLGMRANSSSSPLRESQGRLGAIVEPVEGGFRVIEILPGGPAERSPTPLAVGDVVTAVEFEPFAAGDTLERRLQGRVGKETAVSIRRERADGEVVETTCLLVPVSSGGLRNLVYDATQRRAAELVEEWSEGRLGYTHVRSMNTESLEAFEGDLFAAADGRDGLLIDVRNNGGGFTADRLLSSIMVQPHAYTVPRGADPAMTSGYPRDRLFIQRYVLPINMLCNEKSFSNAEIVSHAFKTLGRGTLVGMPTYGGVISTGRHTLLDGSSIRMPFRGWFLPDGTDMENNGAVPDLVVPQTPEDEVAGRDPQLRAAVEDLLGRLEASGSP
jgi:tricorn protease